MPTGAEFSSVEEIVDWLKGMYQLCVQYTYDPKTPQSRDIRVVACTNKPLLGFKFELNGHIWRHVETYSCWGLK